MHKRLSTFVMVMMLLVVWVLPANAAGLMAEGATGFNPPGWVGGLLAVLSLLLPVMALVWMRRQR